MKKYNFDAELVETKRLPSGLLHLVLSHENGIPEMLPGQFVELRVDRAPVLLNRPISIFNRTDTALELLVSPVGKATNELCKYMPGDRLGVVGPLGNGFTTDFRKGSKVLLIGGGVGIAPLYYLADTLTKQGCLVDTIFGYRTTPDVELCERFASASSNFYVCTDDGSSGFHGFVSAHPALLEGQYDYIQVCGPKPMMKAVARISFEKNIETEVSLENTMACGIGACLCCVEDTVNGNLCVCKNGPVFNTKLLKWK